MAESESTDSPVTVQVCRVCGAEKPLSEFPPVPPSWARSYPGRTRQTRCRACYNAAVVAYRSKPEQKARISKTMSAYRSRPEFKAQRNAQARERYAKDTAYRAKVLELRKVYSQTEEGRESDRQRSAEYRLANPEKFASRSVLNHAVEGGRFPRPEIFRCVLCGEPSVEYHHHLGYAPEYALAVLPVCKPCHWALEHATVLNAAERLSQ